MLRDHRLGDEEQPLSSSEPLASPPVTASAPGRGHPAKDLESAAFTSLPAGTGPIRHDGEAAASSIAAISESPAIQVEASQAFAAHPASDPQRARLAVSPHRGVAIATSPVGSAAVHADASPFAQPVGSPLSEATVAHRTLQSREENQVVHVTIGRIDVVANTAPAPTIRQQRRAPRDPVTLADYLRVADSNAR